MKIEDKVVIVTGGASGLGKATVKLLAERGAKPVIFDVNEDGGAALESELGGDSLFQKVDVMSEEAVSAGIKGAVDKFGAIHGCVNCAGTGDASRTVGKNGPYPLDRFQFIINLNLVGTFNVLRLVAAEMQNNTPVTEDGERGVIVNTGSVAGIDGQIGQAAYSASKAGIIGMTLPIARDLGKLGIRINTICPGIFNTELLALLPEDMRMGLMANAQFPPRLGDPSEFGALVIHLMENSYINGETIRLDAAMRMPPK